ncbi:protein of unknown function DUF340 [Aquitalea magnusonii]|uniref:Surface protein n=1 Tax=Aquitalea magnusonii TaxID=332411 RepID=A0A3G9GB40_9NEIS|nr:lysine exporter LysO family protein [Aquitalea magnusonii]BBF85098.1 protein of unknown function DUF340 [Aquitalea magnusonii]
MHQILSSILPLLLSLSAGYALGLVLPHRHIRHGSRLLTPLIWLLLFYCGKEFGHVLDDGAALGNTLLTALVYASFTTMLPWGLIVLFMRQPAAAAPPSDDSPTDAPHLLHALRDCLLALGMVGAGAVVSRWGWNWLDTISTTQLLYLLIALVGSELVEVNIGKAWRAPDVVMIPILVILGSMAGGLVAAVCTGEGIWTSLALSSGFGWVTLSSILVSSKLGSTYGAIAMLTDLFRELMAIMMLYLLGARCSREAIGICGATALDATLPLIRLKCGTSHVTLALISGFVLTLTSPVLIMIALASA